jgi:urease accessory protein
LLALPGQDAAARIGAGPKATETTMRLLRAAALILPTLAAGPAFAHGGHADGLVAGLAHPLLGADHLLAMLAIGLWAAQPGLSRARALPAAFLAGMAGGIGLGLLAPVPSGIEHAVAASVLALGLIVAISVRLPRGLALPLAALFGLLHGSVHGAEIGGSVALTAAGMLAASAMLHAAGFGIGRATMQRHALARLGGAGIATAGAALMVVG